jgi:hypothetical protein
VLGGVEWNAQLAAQFQGFMSRIGMSHSFREYFLLPERVILSGGPRYEQFGGQVGRFWIALLPVVLVVSWKDAVVRRCAVPAFVYFVCWAVSSEQTRYLIPILPLLAAAAAIAIARLPGIRSDASASRALRWALGTAAGVYLVVSAAPYLSDSRTWLEQYRLHPRAMRQAGMLPVYDYINERLPQDARLMFLNTNHGFFCKREYIADSFFEASQLNTLLLGPARTEADIAGVLRSEHITHILVWHWGWDIPYPPVLGEFLRDTRMAKEIYKSPAGDRLYAVEIGGATANKPEQTPPMGLHGHSTYPAPFGIGALGRQRNARQADARPWTRRDSPWIAGCCPLIP